MKPNGWTLFFCGLCMGTADLVPGISGGTIAFILGIYQPLLESLKSFNAPRKTEWRFLATLVSGILTAILSFAHLLHSALSHDVYRVYLYAGFFGLILASFIFCVRQVNTWNWKIALGLFLGAASAYFLTEKTGSHSQAVIDLSPGFCLWLMVCGALAVCALLLPGISGSYILTLLGVYPTVIQALVNFTRSLEALAILASLGIGILVGAAIFAKAVSWLLKEYPNMSLAVLSGFMIGAIRSLWPFEIGETLDSPLLAKAAFCAIAGFAVVFLLEAKSKQRIRAGNPS